MDKTARFKVDFTKSNYHPFGLYYRTSWFGRTHWLEVDTYKTKAEAIAHYELIKDLPEYLA